MENAQPADAAACVPAGKRPSSISHRAQQEQSPSVPEGPGPSRRELLASLLVHNGRADLLPFIAPVAVYFLLEAGEIKIPHEGLLIKHCPQFLPNCTSAVGLLKCFMFCPKPHTNKTLPYTAELPRERIMLWLRRFIRSGEIRDHSLHCRWCPLDPVQTTYRECIPTTC